MSSFYLWYCLAMPIAIITDVNFAFRAWENDNYTHWNENDQTWFACSKLFVSKDRIYVVIDSFY